MVGQGKRTPLVSVIMPSYNGGRFIGEAIESIINQTYENWELIIVEDASTDDSLKVIRAYKDKRIKLFCNDINEGIAESTNRGIKESAGKYIALLDDDDIAEKDRLSLQVDYMEEHAGIDVLGGRTTLINEAGKVIGYSGEPKNNPKYIKAMLLFQCVDFFNSTAIIRKEFIQKNHLSYKNGCYGMQDYRFYIESSKVGYISSVNHFLLRHRLHSRNETDRNFCLFQKEREQVYAQFQRFSLMESGFCLAENDLLLINKMLSESEGRCESVVELESLYKVFRELLRQGKEMGIDYLDELEHVCRVKMSEQLIRMKKLF